MTSKRKNAKKKPARNASSIASAGGKIVMVSGGFDPIHIGHIRYIQEAKSLGDRLIVVINNDNWLRAKKGKEFMSEKDRKEIIEAIVGVDEVIISSHRKNPKNPKEMSVAKELMKIKPHIFANGGDRDEKDADNPKSSFYWEKKVHNKLGIKMAYNVGKGGKVRSSSDLVKEYSKHLVKKGSTKK